MRMTALLKDAFREIRRSAGRFLSLFLITAIGCAFFSGVKATMPDMQEAAAQYYTTQNLMDLKLMSSVGVKSEDCAAVKAVEGVRGVMAGYSKDVIYRHGEKTDALKLMSYNTNVVKGSDDDLNRPALVEGRYPEKSGECVVERKLFSPDTFMIGNTLTVAAAGEGEDILDTLTTDSFTIVGIVSSPLYIGTARDQTTIGAGVIESFVLIPEIDFAADYYLELFVSLDATAGLNPYSDAYRDAVQKQKEAVLAAFSESVNARYTEQVAQLTARADAAQEKLDQLSALLEQTTAQLMTLRKEVSAQLADVQKRFDKAQESGGAGLVLRAQYVQTKEQYERLDRLVKDREKGSDEADKAYTGEIASAQAEIDTNRAKLAASKAPVFYTFDRFSLDDYKGYFDDSKKIDMISKVFPVLFLFIAALVCMTAMTRMADEQRTVLGLYKALGYSPPRIITKYLIYAVVPALLGSAAGAVIGMKTIPAVIFRSYKILYTVPNFDAKIHASYLVGCIAVSVVLFTAVVILSVLGELTRRPAQLMRPKAPKAGKRVFLERFPRVWNRMHFLTKVTVRNLLRQKSRFFMTLAGISGATALMITGIGLKYSVSSITSLQFEKIFHYDGIIALDTNNTMEAPDAALKSYPQIAQFVTAGRLACDASAGGEQKYEVNLIGADKDANLRDLVTLRDPDTAQVINLDDSGVVITQKLADLLHLKKGDSITLTLLDAGTRTVRISAIAENYLHHYVYIASSLYQQEFGQAFTANAVFFRLADGADRDALSKAIQADDRFLGVSYVQDKFESFQNSIKSLNAVVLMLTTFAVLLAVTVLYNLASINITERVREIATLKVLGFYESETGAYIFRENAVSTALGIAAGWVLGFFMHRFVVRTAEIDMIMFNRSLVWYAYVLAGLLTAVFALAVNFLLFFRIRNINMVDSLKSVE
ncbi:MAG: ABC transporter permease [Oscillospiraceae bacterium]